MNIGFYLGAFQSEEVGGGCTFQKSVTDEILKQDFEQKVYFYYSAKKNLFEDFGNFKFVNLKYDKDYNVKKVYFKKLKLKKEEHQIIDNVLKRDGVDVLYVISPYVELPKRVPYILTVWDLAHKKHTYFPEVAYNNEFENREKYYNNAVQKAAYTVIGTEVGKQDIMKYYNMDDHRVKTNPMPTPDYVYSVQPDETILDKYNLRNQKYLFYPAQFWAHKNHIRLLKAMRELKKDGYKMVFTGSDRGNISYINETIKAYGLENHVLNIGFVSQAQILALYKNAYALTYASWFGPDNIPPLEAMALGCPVICSDYEGAKEQLGDCALFFDRNNENEIIDAVRKLENIGLKNALIQKGTVLAKERHVSSYVKNIRNILNEFETIRECWRKS